MNVSTKSEYGLRALIYLASKQQEAVPARASAQEWNVPVKYLNQIPKTLKDAVADLCTLSRQSVMNINSLSRR